MLIYTSSGEKDPFELFFRFIQHVLLLTHLSIQSLPFSFAEAFHVWQFFIKNAHTGIDQISNQLSALALANGKSRSHRETESANSKAFFQKKHLPASNNSHESVHFLLCKLLASTVSCGRGFNSLTSYCMKNSVSSLTCFEFGSCIQLLC